jgi:hypothetical protein
MKFKDWINYDFDKTDVIHSAGSCVNLSRILKLSVSSGSPPVSHPIGVCAKLSGFMLSGGIHKILKDDVNLINTKLCYSNVRPICSKGTSRRKAMLRNIKKYNFITMSGYQAVNPQKLSPIDYFKDMTKHKFCVSPEGNGESCYRHYEAILTKGIPIIQEPDNDRCMERWNLPSQIKQTYEDLPVVYTKDYTDLSVEYLNEKYEEILETEYNFDKMKFSYWKDKSLIIFCMNDYINNWGGVSQVNIDVKIPPKR